MSDIDRFWIESPEFQYGRKLVVLAADHDRLVAATKQQHDAKVEQLERQLKRAHEKIEELEKAARAARTRSLGVVKVVK